MKLQETESLQQRHSAVRLQASQVDSLAAVLSRAFHSEPHLVYMIPDDGIRRKISPWFFRLAIQTGRSHGNVF
jgi:hypothetical protein